MIWIVSEDQALPRTLAIHLRSLGEVHIGPPETGYWKEAGTPELVVVLSVDAPGQEFAGLERLLGFLRRIPRPRRAPAPVIYVESAARRPSATLVASLIDDRPFTSAPWPIDPQALIEQAKRSLERPLAPPGLRERARRQWVTSKVEQLYAGIDLVPLRQAIDPRNADRPVLIVGETGTRHGLLARYIHNLAEPPRDELIVVAAASLTLTQIEGQVLGRSAGTRVTVFLDDIAAPPSELQQELGELLSESGALGIEAVRWIASATRAADLAPGLRDLPWLHVDLPPLRERPDLPELASSLLESYCAQTGRDAWLDDEALEELRLYTWPGNLRELERVLTASLAAARQPRLSGRDLIFTPRGPGPVPEIEYSPESRQEPEVPTSEPPEGVTAAARPEEPPQQESPLPETAAHPEGPGPQPGPPGREPALLELVAPLAERVRQPLLAIRTCASLLDQKPDDAELRRELMAIVDGDLARVELLLHRLASFAQLPPPSCGPTDLAALVASELDRQHAVVQRRGLVVLRELDQQAPPALADEDQLRFALAGLLDCALRMVPDGGDLYIASLHRDARGDTPSGHRLLIRFHSPEDVLVGPEDLPGPAAPIEVTLARTVISRMGGEFAADAAGSQDNLVLIELPTASG